MNKKKENANGGCIFIIKILGQLGFPGTVTWRYCVNNFYKLELTNPKKSDFVIFRLSREEPFIPYLDSLPSLQRNIDGPFMMPIVDKYADMVSSNNMNKKTSERSTGFFLIWSFFKQ